MEMFLPVMSVIAFPFPSVLGSSHSVTESLRQLKLSTQHEDFELKKALMCILTTLSSDHTAAKVSKDCFLSALPIYI